MTRNTLFFSLALIPVMVLALCNVVFSSKMVNQGEQIHALESRVLSLNLERKTLEEKLASVQSLQSLKQTAMAEGYAPIYQVAFVAEANTVALK